MLERRVIQFDVSNGGVPKLETVFRRLDLLRPYGLNGLMLYMTSVIQTDTFPALGCGKTPVTKAYLKELDAGCRKREIELIPILQILGHHQRLLALDEFERFGELPPPRNQAGMNNFLPHVPEARQLVKRWLDEVLPCFSSRYVHVGCDEIYSFGTARSREYVERHGVEETLADYLRDFHRFLAERGKVMMMWPDMIIHFPALRDLLPEDIILLNWGYGLREDAYEKDNHHFAMHPFVTRKCKANWSYGNNQAEYVFPSFQRLTGNTDVWLQLGAASQAEGFVASEWGTPLHVLSLMGDLYVLMRIARDRLEIGEFLAEFSRMVLGRKDEGFIHALDLMGHAQQNPRYFADERLLRMGPLFRGLMMDDPAEPRAAARFACLRERGLVRLEEDMRKAVALMDAVNAARVPQPDYADDLKMLSRRLLMIALRARLGCSDAWDTGCIWHSPQSLAPLHALLQEYSEMADKDIEWHMRRWDDENLETERQSLLNGLVRARDSMRRRVLDSPVTSSLMCHTPKPAPEP